MSLTQQRVIITRMRALALVTTLALATAWAPAATIVAITLDAKVYTINTVTGVPTLVSDYAFNNVRGLAYHAPRNTYYFVANNNLYEFTLGGQPVLRRNLEFVLDDMWDIAIDRAGVVWGTESVTSGPERLWRFGTVSGSTFIGETLLNGEMDFGEDGSLYLWHSDGNPTFDGLFVVNKTNADAVRINPVGDPPNFSAFCTMETLDDAFGYAFNGQFHSLNLLSGQTALVGGPNMDFRGAAHGVAKKFPCSVALGAINFGQLSQNPDGALADRDNRALRICKFLVPNASLPPIRFEINVDGISGVARMDMIWKAKMSSAGAFTLAVQGKRLVDGVFETIAAQRLSTTYTVDFRSNLSSTPYLDATGAGTFRIEVQQGGPAASPNICLDLDQFAVSAD